MTTTSDSDEASPPADPSIGPQTPNAPHEGDTETEELRVVDRRWWKAKDDTAGDGVETADRKPSYVEELEQRIESLNATVREYAGKYKSASQEFEDARARMRRELGKEAERDRRTFLAELLDVLDNLDRALAAGRTATDAASLLTGVELARTQFLAQLGRLGVTRLEADGQPFDPSLHDAITTTPADAAQDNRVVSVIKEGYRIGDEVLRPASVVVGQAADTPAESEDGTTETGPSARSAAHAEEA
ncbi:MAG: nucleotide exchange factor GrpE [Vicinamibacterales bacterium]|jgi:molecular chaperone GrpE|nr:nucleotide exchange factor GrpE [Vicinamibacterales bacterium]